MSNIPCLPSLFRIPSFTHMRTNEPVWTSFYRALLDRTMTRCSPVKSQQLIWSDSQNCRDNGIGDPEKSSGEQSGIFPCWTPEPQLNGSWGLLFLPPEAPLLTTPGNMKMRVQVIFTAMAAWWIVRDESAIVRCWRFILAYGREHALVCCLRAAHRVS